MSGQFNFILHLGAHKTATTHFQQSLTAQDDILIRAGVRFYGPAYIRERGRAIVTMFGLTKRAREKATRSPAEQLAFLAKDGQTVFVSEENFIGHMLDEAGNMAYPIYSSAKQNLLRLADRLGDQPLHILFALRNPATFLTSVYGQRLFSGRIVAPEDFVAANALEKLDWVPLIRDMASIPTVKSICLWTYEDYPAVFPKIMQTVLPEGFDESIEVQNRIVHPGLSRSAVMDTLDKHEKGLSGPLAFNARDAYPAKSQVNKFSLYPADVIAAEEVRYQQQLAQIRTIDKVTLLSSDHDAPIRRLENPATTAYVRGGSNRKDQKMAKGSAPAVEKRKRTNPIQFVQQTRAEIAKVVWPTRREVLLTTAMVFVMAIILAIFFSLIDFGIRAGLTGVLGYFGS